MTHSESTDILIVDDSELVRVGLTSLLEAQAKTGAANLRIVGEANSAGTAVTEAARLKPDVVLLDIRLPDGSGLEACRKILAADPDIRVLILTSFLDDNLVYEAMSSGAHGYLLKEINSQALSRAVQDVAAGKYIMDSQVTARVLSLVRSGNNMPASEPSKLATLSAQELRVLALVAEGKTNKQVAEEMELSDKTVKNYLSNIFEKLKVSRRAQAAVFYSENRSG